MDVALAGALLVCALPFMALIALAVRLSSPGPVLFRQERMGRHGRVFQMLKFRSMRVEDTLSATSPQPWSEPGDILFKPERDPRVTPLGRLLRRSSLDELPQPWNVLRGGMSFIGPPSNATL